MGEDTGSGTSRGFPVQLVLSLAVALPGALLGAATYLGLPLPDLPPYAEAVVYGTAIVGAAFLLSWAAEAAQVDVSAGLALAVLAFLAVLPEYAVDFVFTWRAGDTFASKGECVAQQGENPCALALANMTGSNRILVGVGWPLVALVAALAARRRPGAAAEAPSVPRPGKVHLAPDMVAGVVFLGIATLYSLTLPLRSSLTLVDAGVLVAIFVAYAWRLAQAPAEDPDLMGTSLWIGSKEKPARRRTVGLLFGFAGLVVLATAEHFAESLVSTGEEVGVDQFLLVQWVAPLASESPELIVACLYAWRLKASDSLGTLLSSKVNQWTLLVGTIPIVFAISSFSFNGLPLDSNQRYELLITAAQSLFAVSLLVNLNLARRGSLLLLVLFSVQFVSSIVLSREADQVVVLAVSGTYGALAAGQLFLRRGDLVQLVRDGLRTPFDELAERTEEEDAAAGSS
jgi:cation:H+ antiporter